MDASIGFLFCCLVGSAVGYYVQRDIGYNQVPNNFYSGGNPSFIPEQSQRLFWGNQGSNQVGGTGLWATLTNKFPFLGTMFGRMELPAQYGPPTQYGTPNQFVPTQFQVPGGFQPQVYRSQLLGPSGRDVALTDDAVIVTPPHVPIVPPAPVPVPAPTPAPVPKPAPGYQYNKPQYRLELPQKYQ